MRARLSALVAFAACQPTEEPWVPGEHGPIAEGISGALGDPGPWANQEQLATFRRGQEVARHTYDRSEGLGPAFNLTSCAGCHEKPVVGGSAGTYRNFFLTGARLDDGTFVPGASAGMAGGVLRLYSYWDDEPARPPIPDTTNVFGQRNPIPFFGVGLLAELSNEELLEREDVDDADGDGISGRANWDQGFVGRFGVKSQTVDIEGFIRGPLFNHLGLTSDPLTDDQRAALPVDSSAASAFEGSGARWTPLLADLLAYAQAAAPAGPTVDDDGVPDPELPTTDLFDLVSFAMLTAAPRFAAPTDATRHGAVVFDQAGCRGCHTPRLDGPRGPLPVYSDLLLHDMGPALADGIDAKEAEANEFRTQPLWGVAAEGPYLHDGRAHTLDEAILWHGGEAGPARDAYADLAPADRDDLLAFLGSLGGSTQASRGLLPPDAPPPEAGTWGGPLTALDGERQDRFLAGRILFDREFGLSEGLGAPRLNGDSCRACHFQPVIGGAGPRDVNVTRHGLTSPDGRFVPPSVGTLLHRTTARIGDGNQPQADATIFEMRQTPHLFGLGLVASIPDEAILANADPHDADEDGISGKPSWTDGGRLGRFGWKAQVPTIHEFVRDALTAELGLTLPDEPGLTFGRLQDDDAVPDPEVGAEEIALLTNYLANLAPPPRTGDPTDPRVLEGEAHFSDLGCAACHVPALPGAGGDVPLYSDLLLHEVLRPGAAGIEDASATMTEFRTPPLWGLGHTAPYLHDGRADTLEQAVLGHDGEALAARDAFEALGVPEREALLSFLGTL